MIPASEFDRLIELGRRRGSLEIDEIRRALPVDTMTADELAAMVVRLDKAGISVDIDPILLAPYHGKARLDGGKPEGTTSRDAASPASSHASNPSVTSSSGKESEGGGKESEGGSSHPPVTGRPSFPTNVIIYGMAAALILILLAWAAWRSI